MPDDIRNIIAHKRMQILMSVKTLSQITAAVLQSVTTLLVVTRVNATLDIQEMV